MLELASLAEVECRARQALLQDRHDRDEHLRADLRVEFEVLLDVDAIIGLTACKHHRVCHNLTPKSAHEVIWHLQIEPLTFALFLHDLSFVFIYGFLYLCMNFFGLELLI